MKPAPQRIRFGYGCIDGKWRVITQTNDNPAVIYDPGYDTREEAKANSALAAAAYEESLDDAGVTWVRAR